MTDCELEALVSQAFLYIAHQVAHIDPCCSTPVPLAGHLKTFIVEVRGDYRLNLALCIGSPALRELAKGMRRGAETDDATAAVYVTEFFNIFCGKIVSNLNQMTHTSARFGVPRVTPGAPAHTGNSYYYRLQSGPALIQAKYQ